MNNEINKLNDEISALKNEIYALKDELWHSNFDKNKIEFNLNHDIRMLKVELLWVKNKLIAALELTDTINILETVERVEQVEQVEKLYENFVDREYKNVI